MRINTDEPSLILLFQKGQVGLIRLEFQRKDDVIESLNKQIAQLRALDSLETVSLTDSTNWQTIGAYAEAKEEIIRLNEEIKRLNKSINSTTNCKSETDKLKAKVWRLQQDRDYFSNKLDKEVEKSKSLSLKIERLVDFGEDLINKIVWFFPMEQSKQIWIKWNELKSKTNQNENSNSK